MMKSNYKNTQNKLQEDCANWFIELIKKGYLKKITFPKNFKGFYKKWFWINGFNLFIYKKRVNLFSQFQKKVIYIYSIKRIYYKILIWPQKLFFLLLQKMNEFLQFYSKKYFNLFSFKKSDLYKLLKNIYNFICKRNFN